VPRAHRLPCDRDEVRRFDAPAGAVPEDDGPGVADSSITGRGVEDVGAGTADGGVAIPGRVDADREPA